ncbi:MAG: hypothetical protein JWN67_2335 [Actinomycetia bacterium]|nr:hypothetical protein [Actinomycetes bacterium]
MPSRLAVIVIPCLNEELLIEATCASLGFGSGAASPSAHLVLVDNMSTDRTMQVCQRIVSRSQGSATVVQEPDRGFAPARRRGILAAERLSAAEGVSAEDVVIVQCDADTSYSDGYVPTMAAAVRGQARSIAEARTELPSGFADRYPIVTEAVDELDSAFERRFPPSSWNVLLDDKACAFGLSDCLSWGGHGRETLEDGSEALAETTRLMITARASGAHYVQALEAVAVHSPRRLLEDAAQLLATSGFPYEHRRALSDRRQIGIDELEHDAARNNMEVLELVLALRSRHLVALQAVLPAHLERTIQGGHSAGPEIVAVVDRLPRRSLHDALTRPAVFLDDSLRLVWRPTCPEFETLMLR